MPIPDAYTNADEAAPGEVPDLEVWGCMGTMRWRYRPIARATPVLQQLYGQRSFYSEEKGQPTRWFDVPTAQ